MGLESHLKYELEKIGVYYGKQYSDSNLYVDNSVYVNNTDKGEAELIFGRNISLEHRRYIVKVLRKTKEFNPVWRGKRVILESMDWAGGKKR